jgi:hypothetical protein
MVVLRSEEADTDAKASFWFYLLLELDFVNYGMSFRLEHFNGKWQIL